ncbi:MAG: RNA polymerase sigma factor [Syntrophomonas sp.]
MAEDEFLRLLKTEEGKLFRIALAILGNEHDAWDSLQQTAEKAWNKRSTLKGGITAFPAWIKKILLNQSLNILRTRNRQIPTDPQEMIGILDLPTMKNKQDIDIIWDLVLELGPEHRTVIALRYLGDLSLKEIASELGISLGTVKSRLYTAHTRLRQKLQDNNLKGADKNGF